MRLDCLAIVHFSHAAISACPEPTVLPGLDSMVDRPVAPVGQNWCLGNDPNVHHNVGSVRVCHSTLSNIVCIATIPPLCRQAGELDD